MENTSLKSQLRELKEKLRKAEAIKTAAEILQKNGSKAGGDWGERLSDEYMRSSAVNQIKELTKQIEQTKEKLADSQSRLNTNRRETNLNNSLKGRRTRPTSRVDC